MKKLLLLFLVGLVINVSGQAICSVPDTVYIRFEAFKGSPPKYEGHMYVTIREETKRAFNFGYNFPDVFTSEKSLGEITSEEYAQLNFFSVSELLRMEDTFVDCMDKPYFFHDKVFKNILLIEVVGNQYLMHKVSWHNIVYN